MAVVTDNHSGAGPSNRHLLGSFVESVLDDDSTSSEFDAGLNIDDSDDCASESKTRNELNETATISISHATKFAVPQHISDRSSSSPISILKVQCRSDPRFISNTRRSWKSLPAADLDKILQQANALNSSIQHTQSAPPLRRNSVSFDTIRVRLYSQTVGDNPAVSYGPPISLDWDYVEQEEVTVDDYESQRPKRRTLRQMALSYYHRKNLLLLQYGVSEGDLKKAKKQAERIKMKRSITKTFLPVMTVESALESASRRAMHLVRHK
ncbi:hypothetical protein IV203_004064 [Nitzschia inconspicua]|uniref:Uncharacterized protein n=1 Tax=Nitzschia inconspicua TaxID=303405 RepID=A0A9K3L4W8_9STRA|nr:hypothetical protein IV203_004064 [Nitzschia inconspicua]